MRATKSACDVQASKALLRGIWVKDLVDTAAEILTNPLERPQAVANIILDLSQHASTAPAYYLGTCCWVKSSQAADTLQDWVAQQLKAPEAHKKREDLRDQAQQKAAEEAEAQRQEEEHDSADEDDEGGLDSADENEEGGLNSADEDEDADGDEEEEEGSDEEDEVADEDDNADGNGGEEEGFDNPDEKDGNASSVDEQQQHDSASENVEEAAGSATGQQEDDLDDQDEERVEAARLYKALVVANSAYMAFMVNDYTAQCDILGEGLATILRERVLKICLDAYHAYKAFTNTD